MSKQLTRGQMNGVVNRMMTMSQSLALARVGGTRRLTKVLQGSMPASAAWQHWGARSPPPVIVHSPCRGVPFTRLQSTTTTATATTKTVTFGHKRDLVRLDWTPVPGVAIVTMQSPPVNSLSLEMCQALSQAIKAAEADASIQAVVLQSATPSIFSAGLDLMEMQLQSIDGHRSEIQGTTAHLADFWRNVQQVYLDWYGSRLACIAAIEGHAPAAGCMLALCCDIRIMAGVNPSSVSPPATIGLNEAQLGIVAPPWLAQQYIDTIGRRAAEKALSLGSLYTAEQALQLNLVDEVVNGVVGSANEQDQDKARISPVRRRALDLAQLWTRIPSQARFATKQLIRKERIDHVLAHRQEDVDQFVSFISSDNVQANLAAYLQKLTSKRTTKKTD